MALRKTRAAIATSAVALVAATTIGAVPAASAQTGDVRTSCKNNPWKPLEVAHEILNTSTVVSDPREAIPTYKGDGSNPVSDAVWNAGYVVPSPYVNNTTRNLQFNESQFLGSPGAPLCEITYVTTSDGYTWGAMSLAINAMWPFNRDAFEGASKLGPYYAGNMTVTPPAGVVKVTANFKAQNMKFWANENGVAPGTAGAVPILRFFITDKWGNEYVMHASGKSTPDEVKQAFDAAVLPEGWTKDARYLSEDLIIRPAEGSDGTFHYLVFRDSADNTYHQMKWSPRGNLEAQVPLMPIWGGQQNDRLVGDVTHAGRPDVIHGAGGNDRLKPGTGNDEVWGDAGFDTVVLPGKRASYRVVSTGGSTSVSSLLPVGDTSDIATSDNQVTLKRGKYTVSLNYVEVIRFSDGKVKVVK